MRAQAEYTAASANRASVVADGGLITNGANGSSRPLIAYASHKSVVIWNDPLGSKRTGVEQLLPTSFSSEITLLTAANRTVSSAAAEASLAFFLAGSRTGELILLRPHSAGHWTRTALPLKAHSATVTTAHILETNASHEVFTAVTGSADGKLIIWRIHAPTSEDDAQWSIEATQTISAELKGALPLCVQLSTLQPESSQDDQIILLAVAVTKSYVQLWTHDPSAVQSSSAQPHFSLALQLSGHEDWVRALAFARVSRNELVLASGGQDNYVRLWRIARHSDSPVDTNRIASSSTDDDYIEKLMRKIELGDEDADEQSGNASSSANTHKVHSDSVAVSNGRAFAVGSGTARSFWVVTMDALLMGHDSWVTSLRWHPPLPRRDGSLTQPAALLSTSADNSVIVWAPAATLPFSYVEMSSEQANTSIWAPQQRFGELGAGSSLGFYGGLWVPPSRVPSLGADTAVPIESAHGIFCHAFNGATRLWAPVQISSGRRWSPQNAITGHLGPCKGLSWDPSGCMLLSCGSDRTTRLHARFRDANKPGSHSWHEVARPQTHGYDLNGVTWVDQWSFASAADEKVVRVFTAPASFIQTIRAVGGLDGAPVDIKLPELTPVGASVPPLGLSNRAIYDESAELDGGPSDSGQPVGNATTSVAGIFTSPPNEDELHVSTLWPELDKLYGHGYELFSVGASHAVASASESERQSVSLVASSCKASSAEHAVIRLHDRAQNWKEVAKLSGHNLSITRIRFHPGSNEILSNQLVLSSGRDRSWHLHQFLPDSAAEAQSATPATETGQWRLVATQQAHARIVWDCAWSQDGKMFATASRDKTVKLWSLDFASPERVASVTLLSSIKLEDSCTSVAFGQQNLIAVGTERGSILFFRSQDSLRKVWERLLVLSDAHSEAVQELAFRPVHGSAHDCIASAGDDGCVRLHRLIEA